MMCKAHRDLSHNMRGSWRALFVYYRQQIIDDR